MTLKEARKATRGMYTRIETINKYAVTQYDQKAKQTTSNVVSAENIKQAKRFASASGYMILDIELVDSKQVMYAMERDTFKINAQKIIELEELQ